ncbi:MAG: phosphoribosylformylglycinamidine synthase I [Anaerolineae bacterium]|nr:phosphoribosylformylglycinamidine synthase I [Anaerolineae bacterium]
MNNPPVLILHATGTNRDHDAAWAVEKAGGQPEIVHVNKLRETPWHMHDYQMMVLPGGFSYGDALGAGRLWASDMRWLFQDEMALFIDTGKPVIGICNGFQALVKSGWLPGPPDLAARATLTRNESNKFECRWVWLEPTANNRCVFTKGLSERIYCPVAHGEGRFIPRDNHVLDELNAQGQIVLTYVRNVNSPASQPAGYPANPNGSVADIAGICNARGTVLGLMPHPENHIVPEQHPRWAKGEKGNLGLALFENGIKYAAQI